MMAQQPAREEIAELLLDEAGPATHRPLNYETDAKW